MAHARLGLSQRRCVFFFAKMDLCAGLAPACAVYGTAASLPMLAEHLKSLLRGPGRPDAGLGIWEIETARRNSSGPLDLLV
jgi:hypothetical protein